MMAFDLDASSGPAVAHISWEKVELPAVDGKKVAQSDLVEISAGPHVVAIECIGTPRPFSSRKIKETIDYDLQAKDGHTYEINAELVGGMCKLWIEDTTKH